MPLIQSSTDSLPYIDAPPSNEALASANALIQADLSSQDTTPLHPSLPKAREPAFSPLIQEEHNILASNQTRSPAVDLERYEALDAPPRGEVEAWKASLQKAHASAEYLRGRETNLGLLEAYGKNAWLIGNSQLEDILKGLEREVEEAKLDGEGAERERRIGQEGQAGEVRSLQDGWRRGVGRMIEVQAAAEGLRQEVLERQRKGVM